MKRTIWHFSGVSFAEKSVFCKRQEVKGSLRTRRNFSEKDLFDFATFAGNQNAQKFQETVQKHLLHFTSHLLQNKCSFKQNNASIHTARSTKAGLSNKKIDFMPWSSKGLPEIK